MKKEKTPDGFDLYESLSSIGFLKDDIENIWFRPRDGYSIKLFGANNGKEMFSLMNFKRPSNRHIATAEVPHNKTEFDILMSKFSII